MRPLVVLIWGRRQNLDRGTLYRNGVVFDVPAVQLVTVFGFGICRHYRPGSGGRFTKGLDGIAVRSTVWCRFRFVPDGSDSWHPWRRNPVSGP